MVVIYVIAKVRNISEITKSYIYYWWDTLYILLYKLPFLFFVYHPTITNPTSVGFFITKKPPMLRNTEGTKRKEKFHSIVSKTITY